MIRNLPLLMTILFVAISTSLIIGNVYLPSFLAIPLSIISVVASSIAAISLILHVLFYIPMKRFEKNSK